MSENIKRLLPLFNRVLVRKADPICRTKGGIELPKKEQQEILHGTVVAVGPGSRNDQGRHLGLSIKVGDHVLLPQYGGTKIRADDGNSYQLYKENEILAKVELWLILMGARLTMVDERTIKSPLIIEIIFFRFRRAFFQRDSSPMEGKLIPVSLLLCSC